ncbi:LVIVD repeat-containing protein [Corallococcus sp. RDP092CA]|uniref:LVIVD repeat-containing protein n=1 Tax=Corallococcus sp. RDP092CA TaxID=3109369 RepID=UPI0035ADD4BC
MNRFPLVLTIASLAVGCGKDSSANKAECQVEAIDLTGCDRSTLSAVQAEGIWNANINFDDGYTGPSSIRFSPGEPLVVGLAMTAKQVTADTFYLAGDATGSDGSAVRYAFSGCKASGPGEVLGVARVCRNGATVLQGTFTARRVERRAGEAESDRVELLGQGVLPRGAANGVSVAGDYAYVIAGSEGLFVFNVSDPAHPTLVSEQKLPSETYTSTLISGTTLYLGTYATGIRICDLAANPAVPTCDKTVLADLTVRVDGMAKEGNLLYVASPLPKSDIVILDVTQPSAPTLVVRYTVEGSSPDLSEYPYALAVQDGRLYVSNWSYGMTVTDLAPLATTTKLPKILGRFAGPSTSALAVGKLGDATVVYQGSDAWGSSLLALDATHPENIVQRGELALRPEATLGGMALSGTTLYVANYQDGLRVYDVSTLGTPKAAGYFNTWSETDAGRGLSYFDGLQGVHVANGLVYGWDTTRGLLIFRHTP